MKKIIIYTLFLILLLSSCSVQKYQQTTTAVEDMGYLKLKGDLANRTITLNDSAVHIIDTDRLSLVSGTYNLHVLEDGQTILRRNIYITAGQTVEVSLP